MNTIIIYATKHNTTKECVSKLSKKLAGTVDLYQLKGGVAPDLSKYDKVIIGGSIYAGRIQKEVSEFCLQNLDELKKKKTGLFICCIFKNSEETQLNGAFPKELLDSAAARESFGGEIRFSDMSIAERLITKMVSKVITKSDGSLASIDMKKDVSMINDAKIDKFAKLMNKA